MLNRILIEGKFPCKWKLACVTPIFKGGDTKDMANYRPISVLPILSKLLEKHINSHIYCYLDKNNLLHPLQSGFRPGFSCSDAIHKIISECMNSKAQGYFISLIFLDFKKAFDCVNHQILLKKIRSFGIIGSAYNIIMSFLSQREQFVKVRESFSETLPISVGVPQGSILAPTLFLIFINDFLKLPLNSTSFAYADDTTFLAKDLNIYSLERQCNNDLACIKSWCLLNRMTINMKKSHFLLCNSSKSQTFNLFFGGTVLARESKTKLLGFHLCDTLGWTDHIQHICRTVRSSLALLQKCRFFIDRGAALKFYHQFIFCHLIYGIHL